MSNENSSESFVQPAIDKFDCHYNNSSLLMEASHSLFDKFKLNDIRGEDRSYLDDIRKETSQHNQEQIQVISKYLNTLYLKYGVSIVRYVEKAMMVASKMRNHSQDLSGKLGCPVSLKQPGPRNGTLQCFIKRDRSNMTYHLFLCLSPALPMENGTFLLSAKQIPRSTCTEYEISTNPDNISRSSNTYMGKMRSNFLGTKFTIYDTQPPHKTAHVSAPGFRSHKLFSKRVYPKVPTKNYKVGMVTYKYNLPMLLPKTRNMHCTISSYHENQPEILQQSLEDSFRNINLSKSVEEKDDNGNETPLVFRNKRPYWNTIYKHWWLDFRRRSTMSSVKNFQLIADAQPSLGQSNHSDHENVILQFGKVGKDMFTMEYRDPLSAFHAFAICLSTFDIKLGYHGYEKRYPNQECRKSSDRE